MQFNNKITAISNSYNEYGEEVEQTRKELRCCILANKKSTEKDENSFFKSYDLKIITAHKSFAPYSQIFSDDTLVFEYAGLKYAPKVISSINDFSGKAKYCQIEMDEVKNGS